MLVIIKIAVVVVCLGAKLLLLKCNIRCLDQPNDFTKIPWTPDICCISFRFSPACTIYWETFHENLVIFWNIL